MSNRLSSLTAVTNWAIGCLFALYAALNMFWLAFPIVCRMWSIRDCLIAISTVSAAAWLTYSVYALDVHRLHLRKWLPLWAMGGILLSSSIHVSPVTDPCEGQPYDPHGNAKIGIAWTIHAFS